MTPAAEWRVNFLHQVSCTDDTNPRLENYFADSSRILVGVIERRACASHGVHGLSPPHLSATSVGCRRRLQETPFGEDSL